MPLQKIDIPTAASTAMQLSYDAEWAAILNKTNELLSVDRRGFANGNWRVNRASSRNRWEEEIRIRSLDKKSNGSSV